MALTQWRVKVFCRHTSGQSQVNSLAVEIDDAGSALPNNVDHLAESIFSPIKTRWMTITPTTTTVDGVMIHPLPDNGVNHGKSYGAAGTGSLTGDVLPPQIATVASLRSLLGAPSRRGRIFLPSPTEGECQASGTPSTTYLAACKTAIDALITGLTIVQPIGVPAFSLNMRLIVWSKKLSQVCNISSCVMRTKFGTHRSRSALNKGDQVF